MFTSTVIPLADLLEKFFGPGPTRNAVLAALKEHPPDAQAIVINGLTSYNPRSNCSRFARGLGWKTWKAYQGGKVPGPQSLGYYNVVVRTDQGD